MKKESNDEKQEGSEVEDISKEKKSKNKTIFSAMGYALNGLIHAFKTERNLRIDYLIGMCVFIFSLFFDFTKTEFACLCLTIGFVIFAEMINSTVEAVVDLITDKYHEKAKIAKDVAAGGVLVASIVAVVVAYFLFVDKLSNATTVLLEAVLSSPLHILASILFIVLLAIVILKGVYSKDINKHAKSFPSARVALSFAMAMYIWIMTKSVIVGCVGFALCFIIAQLKMQDEGTTIVHIILSALLGVLLVVIIYQLILVKNIFLF